MNQEKVKFGVVGLGHIGKRHASIIHEHSEAILVATCDLLSAEELGLAFSEARHYRDLQEMLSKEKLDVLCVCTPNGQHIWHSSQALQQKVHVLCEKPLGLNYASCLELEKLAKKQKRTVFCVMQNRFSPPTQWLKSIVSQGIIGDVFMVSINCFWNRDERYYTPDNWRGSLEHDGGTLFTQFSHFIDLLYWVFGDIKNVAAVLKDFSHQSLTEFEDSGIVKFEFVNGGMGTLCFSTSVWDKNMESSINVIGSKGSLRIGGQYMNELQYCHIQNYETPVLKESNQAIDYGPYKGSAFNHIYAIQNVIDVLKRGAEPATRIEEGAKVVDMIERIYQSGRKYFQKQNEPILLESKKRK